MPRRRPSPSPIDDEDVERYDGLEGADRRARWIEGAVSRVRPYIELIWPLRDGPRYRELSTVAVFGDVLFDPRTLHVELLSPPALAAHHLAQAHDQVRDELDSYIFEVGMQDFDAWPEAMHRCSSSGHWYSALPWCLIDPRPEAQQYLAARRRDDEARDHHRARERAARGLPPIEPPPVPSLPTHCPLCATATVHDPHARVFRCPACAWHD